MKVLILGLDLKLAHPVLTLFVVSNVNLSLILYMSHNPLGEPPPGTDLSANHGSLNIDPVIATYALAVTAVGLRFYTRVRVQAVRIAADDWMIVAALVCC